MVLGFKEKFVQKILDGTKKHTIRADSKNRWGRGVVIHMATGVRTKKYKQFNQDICMGVQDIEFIWFNNNKYLLSEWGVRVLIDGKDVTNNNHLIDELVKNDGFDSRKDFFEWDSWNKKNFKGKLIHWTHLKY